METEKKKVLIVEDDDDVITVVKTILTQEGYEIESAKSKKEALEKLQNKKFDIAILDVMMSDRHEGFELAQEIKTNPELKHMPILIQSSIDVLFTSKSEVREMASQYRQHPDYKDLQVLLVKNAADGTAGIDYLDEEGKTHWFPVNGFIRKPVEAEKLIEAIEKHS